MSDTEQPNVNTTTPEEGTTANEANTTSTSIPPVANNTKRQDREAKILQHKESSADSAIPKFKPPPPLFDSDLDNDSGVAIEHHPLEGLGRAPAAAKASSNGSFSLSSFVNVSSPSFNTTKGSDHVQMYEIRAMSRKGLPEKERATYWKILLGHLPLDKSMWQKTLQESQVNYREMLVSVLKLDAAGNIVVGVNDRTRIDVDIPRTIPNLHFFAAEETIVEKGVPVSFSPHQQSLRRILHLFAKVNPGLGYVQGMNEIVGHLLFTFATEQTHHRAQLTKSAVTGITTTTSATTDNDEGTVKQPLSSSIDEADCKLPPSTGSKPVLEEETTTSLSQSTSNISADSELVEGDVFFCFQKLMILIGDNFCRALDNDHDTGVGSSMHVFSKLLQYCDSELWEFLEELKVMPEFYAFRWITLVLTQEFMLPDVLRLWDFLFSFGDSLGEALFFTAVAMIMMVRSDILGKGFNIVLPLLQHYPPDVDIDEIITLSEQLMSRLGLNLPTLIRKREDETPEVEEKSMKETVKEMADAASHKWKGWMGKMKDKWKGGGSSSSTSNSKGGGASGGGDQNAKPQ